MMKKIMLFTAACVALAACNKNIDTTAPKTEEAMAFEKGQSVTLAVNTEEPTRVTSSLDATTGAVNFAWEAGDKIKVTVGTESAEFTLSSGAGTATAEFTGIMPAAGNTFDVQYPVEDPDLSSQTYVTNGLPKDKMKMAASNCTIDTPFTLNPQYAALRLNLYGLNREVSQIVVTNTTVEPNVSYTLNCGTAVRVGNSESTATPFLLVVAAGSSAWNFKVDVTASEATTSLEAIPTYSDLGYEGSGIVIPVETFSTSSGKTFTAAQVLNMPAKAIASVWAPVNCGYVAKTGDSGEALGYPYGKLYQWGRKYGQGYSNGSYTDATYPTGANNINFSTAWTTHPDDTDENKDKFYWKNQSNWYQGGGTGAPDADSLWGMSKTEYDPCPTGWRVPTGKEMEDLMSHTSLWTTKDGMKGKYFSGSTTYSESVPRLFLCASGCHGGNNGACYDREIFGNYWSSSASVSDTRKANGFIVGNDNKYTGIADIFRTYGCAIRCIKE